MSVFKGFLIISFCIVFSNASEYVPVLIWGVNEGKFQTQSSSLEKLSSYNFYDYVKDAVSHTHNSVIVAFTEENLSVEDFSWKDADGKIAFPHIQKLSDTSAFFEYLPSVHAPLKGLKHLVKDGFEIKNIHLGRDKIESLKLQKKDKVIVIVKLDDALIDEDRPKLLRRHDATISEVYNHLVDEGCSVLALYTGHHSSWAEGEEKSIVHRTRRLLEVSEGNSTNYTLWTASGETKAMLYSSVAPIIQDGGKPFDFNATSVSLDSRNSQLRLIASSKLSGTLRVVFSSDKGYWKLINIEYAGANLSNYTVLTTDIDIEAPLNFSYHCSQNVTFVNGSTLLNFTGFQVQPFLNEFVFDDAYDCVWFFTTPIWAGLFVTALLGLILIWGLSMILSIRTMDQFDDPKGKTITITAMD